MFSINKEESATQRVMKKSIGQVFVKLLLSRNGWFRLLTVRELAFCHKCTIKFHPNIPPCLPSADAHTELENDGVLSLGTSSRFVLFFL
jgi:hypothetical protein